VIVASHLTRTFGDRLAVEDVTFEVRKGEVFGLLGPNGAGKTTTLRMLLGLVSPDRGVATIDGQRYVDLDRPARSVGAALEASSFHQLSDAFKPGATPSVSPNTAPTIGVNPHSTVLPPRKLTPSHAEPVSRAS